MKIAIHSSELSGILESVGLRSNEFSDHTGIAMDDDVAVAVTKGYEKAEKWLKPARENGQPIPLPSSGVREVISADPFGSSVF